MKVAIRDVLDIDMSLSGTSWKQTVTDEQTGKSVDFDFKSGLECCIPRIVLRGKGVPASSQN